ncbi:hypothetical protein ISCU110981_03850 [Isoptericola cucumis]
MVTCPFASVVFVGTPQAGSRSVTVLCAVNEPSPSGSGLVTVVRVTRPAVFVYAVVVVRPSASVTEVGRPNPS